MARRKDPIVKTRNKEATLKPRTTEPILKEGARNLYSRQGPRIISELIVKTRTKETKLQDQGSKTRQGSVQQDLCQGARTQ